MIERSSDGVICHQGRRGGGVLRVMPPIICLEMRLGERTRLTKFGELTQDRQHPELLPETSNMIWISLCLSPFWYPVTQFLSTN